MKRKVAVESLWFPFSNNNVYYTLTLSRETSHMSSEGCWEAGLPAQDWIPLVSLGISMLCLVVLPELCWAAEFSWMLRNTIAQRQQWIVHGEISVREVSVIVGIPLLSLTSQETLDAFYHMLPCLVTMK